jgi:hypothetical protein
MTLRALVTGGISGLGLAAAERLRADGTEVMTLDVHQVPTWSSTSQMAQPSPRQSSNSARSTSSSTPRVSWDRISPCGSATILSSSSPAAPAEASQPSRARCSVVSSGSATWLNGRDRQAVAAEKRGGSQRNWPAEGSGSLSHTTATT